MDADQRAIVRESLTDLCRQLGFDAAAAVLRTEKDGYMAIPRAAADTRDGREEIIGQVQSAFEDDSIAVIVIENERPASLAETCQLLAGPGVPLRGFA